MRGEALNVMETSRWDGAIFGPWTIFLPAWKGLSGALEACRVEFV
jgi:hypothetical protein